MPQPATHQGTIPHRVLVIEDDADTREMIRILLRDRNYELFEADNGRIGLAMIDEVRPDLIILDLLLPGISGLEISRQLRSKPEYSDIPVLVLSGIGDKSDRPEDFWRQGLKVDEFMSKGNFTAQDLLGRVEYLLRREGYRSEGGLLATPRPSAKASESAPGTGFGQEVAEMEREIAEGLEEEGPATPEPSRLALLPPEEVVRRFIESWNTGNFALEFECLGKEMSYGLSKAEYVHRRRQAYQDATRRTGIQRVREVCAVQNDGGEATVEIEREDHRGAHVLARKEIYTLNHTLEGWRIARVRMGG